VAVPVFVGGKLNHIPDGSNTSLPVDISKELAAAGAIVCSGVEIMLERMSAIAAERESAANAPGISQARIEP
jgi:hypothetical protein